MLGMSEFYPSHPALERRCHKSIKENGSSIINTGKCLQDEVLKMVF